MLYAIFITKPKLTWNIQFQVIFKKLKTSIPRLISCWGNKSKKQQNMQGAINYGLINVLKSLEKVIRTILAVRKFTDLREFKAY